MKKVLTIAGSDGSGGAGIQADLKTFAAHGVFGLSVITAVTAQNTLGVQAVQDIDREMVSKQIEAVFDDIEVDAVKIGMVSQTATIETIAGALKKYTPEHIVLDPVMAAKNGCHLLKKEAETLLIKELFPLAEIVTPNIPEAEAITGLGIDNLQQMEEAAAAIFRLGARNVLLKGGHLEGNPTDILYNGREFLYFTQARIETKNTHGTGCTLSSAIAANLALGREVEEAITLAKDYITVAIEHSLPLGRGAGPTHHFYALYKKAGLIP
ncbi:phosphomethylpyrimidine kinase/hydroxymethylpyrimidine kinase [Acididesulfobacillus acetoxydans]|uniref:Hydroxymethylpyrimidine/phosphomethylpyrimidine kinase n=1 Tax=Acididesulfobacillus acetoxydans TaxID=1561005 RepID=A0A8S0X4U2_9FIRM|nr:bifunctional hydroxymethylpyrimidine kinase/phosphomethylpyrimidine kinase [Acididesulfobacillus acetoxydans]CAA7601080.1 phosphomethylpyrimidine kinase/hydroxymethylpyrimidine kinase [Acididesulfobacillus acetoxydans]CEJ06954.1 Thiamine biosynthesis bifunctional protein ThiED [Acididesulfobacillus acetoxydans]